MVPQPYLPFILHLFLHPSKTDFQVTESNETLKFLSYLTFLHHLHQLVFPLETLFSFENTLSGFHLLQWLLLFLLLWEFVFFCPFYCWCFSWCVAGPFCLLSLALFSSRYFPSLLSLFWSDFILYHDLNSLYMLKSLKFISVAQCSFLSFRWKYCTVYSILLLKCLVDISNTWAPNLPPNICPSCRFSILVNISTCPDAEGHLWPTPPFVSCKHLKLNVSKSSLLISIPATNTWLSRILKTK